MNQDAPTRLQLWEGKITAPEYKTFPGGPKGLHRRWICITNEDDTTKLHIVQSGNVDPATTSAKGMTIWKNSTVVLFTSADITLKCVSGTVTTAQVMECFYV